MSNVVSYTGSYRKTGKQCKFQIGNVVYLKRIKAPLRVKNSTLLYQKQKGVVIGYTAGVYGYYHVLFEDGYIARVLSSMISVKLVKPKPDTFIGWEKYIRPEDFEFATPKIDKDLEKQQLVKMREYGFKKCSPKNNPYNHRSLDIKVDGAKIVSARTIAINHIYTIYDASYNTTHPSIGKTVTRNAIPIVRAVVDSVDKSTGETLGRYVRYYSCMFIVYEKIPTLVWVSSGNINALYNSFASNHLMDKLKQVSHVIGDVELSAAMSI